MNYLDLNISINDIEIDETPDLLNKDIISLARPICQYPDTVFLLSGLSHDCSRFSIIGWAPFLILHGFSDSVKIITKKKELSIHGNPLEILKKILNQLKESSLRPPANNKDIPFTCGAMGFFSYELGKSIEKLPDVKHDPHKTPAFYLIFPSYVFIRDSLLKKDFSIKIRTSCGKIPDLPANIDSFDAMDNSCVSQTEPLIKNLKKNFRKSAYIKAINKAKEHILQGDIYQVNLSQMFSCSFKGDPFSIFTKLFKLNPAPFYAFIHTPDHSIISTSPERFIYQNGNYIETRPIKGTMPRGESPKEDKLNAKILKHNPKDDAELSMIVDLMRNDLSKICLPHTVKVVKHKILESYTNVFHLVSVVSGELRPGTDTIDIFKASFPAGSITGCPKIRSMEIITEIENSARGVYTGSIGYISLFDTMDMNVAIRSATIYKNMLYFNVGGGIVYDSKPEMEYLETLHKGKTFFQILSKGDTAK